MSKLKERTYTVRLTDKDLNNFEDFLDCVPVCMQHKKIFFQPGQKDNWKEVEASYLNCGNCDKVRKTWRSGAIRAYSQICKQRYGGKK